MRTMHHPYHVAVMIGSLREHSYSRQLAHAMGELSATYAPALVLQTVEIGHLPFYNEDLERDTPSAWVGLRQQVRAAQALLVVTPEYNRSIPAALKNAVDVLSRPRAAGVMSGKPVAIVSQSAGGIGGFGANQHLRQVMVGVGAACMPDEAYIGGVKALFGSDGALVNDGTREFLGGFLRAFERWVAALAVNVS